MSHNLRPGVLKHDILAMHIAGLPGAALYPGSWSEWIRNPMRPVTKGIE